MRILFQYFLFIVFFTFISGCEQDQDTPPAEAISEKSKPAVTQQKSLPPSPSTSAPVKTKVPDNSYFDAALQGDLLTVEKEISEGVDVNASNENGRTALMLAAFDGYTDLVEFLIVQGAQVNAKDQVNRTALMYAASGSNDATVKLLLERNAEVNAVDNNEQWSALMFAAAEGQTAIVQMLLDNQADWSAKDIDGETARDFAFNNRHLEVVTVLDAAAGSKKD